jgi:hypothetical protein
MGSADRTKLMVLCVLCQAPVVALGQSAATLFEDVSAAAGVAAEHRAVVDVMKMGVGTGAAWLDYDRDRDLDLYVTQGEGANMLFRNDGGRFVDVAEAEGAADRDHAGAAVAAADYDNDGWPDLFLANSDGDVLLRNTGTGFVDVSRDAGIPVVEYSRGVSASWGDFDGDGWLDLYVTNHMDRRGLAYISQDRLYHSNGDGTFSDLSGVLGTDHLAGYGFVGAWTDFDNDGDADLLLINDCPFGEEGRYRPNRLFRNDGGHSAATWSFTEISDDVGAGHCRHGMGLAAGDYNRDGWTDYFYTNIGKRTTLLTNDRGHFLDRAEEAGVFVGFNPGEPGAPFQGTFTWGASFLDYDLDGWIDLYVAAGTLLLTTSSSGDPQPNALFRNRGDGTFVDETSISGLDFPGRGRTTAVADYDGDGDPDVALVDVGESIRLLRNEVEAGDYLSVGLVGSRSNRDGIGARVSIRAADGSWQHAERRSGTSLGATDSPYLLFGLGDHATVDTMCIRWPSGVIQELVGISAGQHIEIVEPTDIAIDEPVVRRTEGVGTVYPNPTHRIAHVELRLEAPSRIRMSVFDALGRRVRSIDNGAMATGVHRLTWDGCDESGHKVAGGFYVIRVETDSWASSRPIVVSD